MLDPAAFCDLEGDGTSVHDHVYSYTSSPTGDEGDHRRHEIQKFDDNAGSVAGQQFRYNANSAMYADDDYIYVYDAYNRLCEIYLDDGSTSLQLDGSDTKLRENWFTCRGQKCASGNGDDFDGTSGPNSVAGWDSYFGPGGSAPVEEGELELNAGDVREVLSGMDPVVYRQTAAAGAGTIQPVGGTSTYWPIADHAGRIHALADPSDGSIVERVYYTPVPVFEPLTGSGTWGTSVTVENDTPSSGQTTITDPDLDTSLATAAVGQVIRVDVFGDEQEYYVSSSSISGDPELVIEGNPSPTGVAAGDYFEITDLDGTYCASSVTTSGTGSGLVTVITLDANLENDDGSAATADSLRHQWAKISLAQPFACFEIVANDDAGTINTITIRGDVTAWISSGDYLQVMERASGKGFYTMSYRTHC